MKSFKKTSRRNNSHSKIKKSKRNHSRTKKFLKKNKKGGSPPKVNGNGNAAAQVATGPAPAATGPVPAATGPVPVKLTLKERKRVPGFKLALPVSQAAVVLEPSKSLDKLKSNIYTSKYIFVFDFDCTLSTRHSMGNPENGVEYLNAEQFSVVGKIFKKINSFGGLIIILSRSVEEQLNKNIQLLKLIPQEFILGAVNDMEKKNPDDYWADKKKITLQEIYNFTNKSKEPIIMFYDDTELNTRAVSDLKFIKAIDVPSQCEDENKGRLLNFFNTSVKEIPQFRVES